MKDRVLYAELASALKDVIKNDQGKIKLKTHKIELSKVQAVSRDKRRRSIEQAE